MVNYLVIVLFLFLGFYPPQLQGFGIHPDQGDGCTYFMRDIGNKVRLELGQFDHIPDVADNQEAAKEDNCNRNSQEIEVLLIPGTDQLGISLTARPDGQVGIGQDP